MLHHMIAGAVAGTTEHCAMFPVDTIKVRATCRSRIVCLVSAIRSNVSLVLRLTNGLSGV
jgi:hypothetical protein